MEQEDLDMDCLYGALDCYKTAQNLAHESKDVEHEAKSCYKLGYLYYKGLRNLKKGKKNYTDVIRLE